MHLKAKRISRSVPIIIHSLMLSVFILFLKEIFCQLFWWGGMRIFWSKNHESIQLWFIKVPSDEAAPTGWMRPKADKNLGQYQPSPLNKIQILPPSSIISRFLVSDKRPWCQCKTSKYFIGILHGILFASEDGDGTFFKLGIDAWLFILNLVN